MPKLTTFSLLSMIVVTTHALGGEVELRRLKTEAPAAVRRIIEGYSRLTAEGHLISYKSGKKKKNIEEDVTLTICDGLEKVVEKFTVDDLRTKKQYKRERILCHNKSTEFLLNRDFQRGGQIVLSDLGLSAPMGQGSSKIASDISRSIKRFAFAPFRFYISVEDLINEKNIKIVAADSLVVDSQNVLRYRLVPDPPLEKEVSMVFELLPDHGWAIHHAKYESLTNLKQGKNAVKFTDAFTVEYGEDQGGLPVPRRVRSDCSWLDDTFEFRKFEFGVIASEREFTLGYYGLPDATRPIALAGRSHHLAYWMFGIGGLSLVGAVVAWQRRRLGAVSTP